MFIKCLKKRFAFWLGSCLDMLFYIIKKNNVKSSDLHVHVSRGLQSFWSHIPMIKNSLSIFPQYVCILNEFYVYITILIKYMHF